MPAWHFNHYRRQYLHRHNNHSRQRTNGFRRYYGNIRHGSHSVKRRKHIKIQSQRCVALSNPISGSGGIEILGSGTTALIGACTYTGATTVTAGKLVMSNQSNVPTSGVVIATGATLEVNRDATADHRFTANDVSISGAGTLEKTGGGTMFVNDSNTGYVTMSTGGMIHIKEGTLGLNKGYLSDWQSNKGDLTVDTGATLDLRDVGTAKNGIFVNGLSGAGTITATTAGTGARLTVGVSNGGDTFSGVITNDASRPLHIVKIGTGTQIFSGANTYTGTTTISGGILQILGSITSPVAVATGGILASGATGTVSGSVSVQTGGGIQGGGDTPGVLTTGALTF
ncbi:hypothetical protein HC928_21640 [bacterium]|nr:hypothetical protein [bacterium]